MWCVSEYFRIVYDEVVCCNEDVVHVSFIVMLMEVMVILIIVDFLSGPLSRDWTGENEVGRYGNQGC